jgi:hypothetical protein
VEVARLQRATGLRLASAESAVSELVGQFDSVCAKRGWSPQAAGLVD